ncbi:unnamed protein product [Cylicocyclus nassatus]|uniref:Uncharacterized protein n=1 Tax=Cylicocyclus nassatus TaxID=53992 RepID=A0AA36HAW1_CYLNA|nr:unnamed protein product [Cylicocyclus nassatus]
MMPCLISKEAEQIERDEIKHDVCSKSFSFASSSSANRARFEKEGDVFNYPVATVRTRLRQYWKEYPGPSREPKARNVHYAFEPFKGIISRCGVKVAMGPLSALTFSYRFFKSKQLYW